MPSSSSSTNNKAGIESLAESAFQYVGDENCEMIQNFVEPVPENVEFPENLEDDDLLTTGLAGVSLENPFPFPYSFERIKSNTGFCEMLTGLKFSILEKTFEYLCKNKCSIIRLL